jgi:membrane protease YdiL (CAAX protease family)
MSFLQRHPLFSFFAIAYGLSWSYWVPLALAGVRVAPGSSATHFPGLLGPALAAFIVTFAVDGTAGVRALVRRMFLVTAPLGRFWAYALSPVVFLALALALAVLGKFPIPALEEFGVYSGLPAIGMGAVTALVLVFNGFGEETGWRGFAQERLRERYGPLGGTLVLALLWAGWHTPAFFFVETYRTMTLPIIVGGFGLGIYAGALVLARVTERTGGSVLAAALWHATYNMTSATAAGRGIVAAVTTMCVMVWATLVVFEQISRRPSRAQASTMAGSPMR